MFSNKLFAVISAIAIASAAGAGAPADKDAAAKLADNKAVAAKAAKDEKVKLYESYPAVWGHYSTGFTAGGSALAISAGIVHYMYGMTTMAVSLYTGGSVILVGSLGSATFRFFTKKTPIQAAEKKIVEAEKKLELTKKAVESAKKAQEKANEKLKAEPEDKDLKKQAERAKKTTGEADASVVDAEIALALARAELAEMKFDFAEAFKKSDVTDLCAKHHDAAVNAATLKANKMKTLLAVAKTNYAEAEKSKSVAVTAKDYSTMTPAAKAAAEAAEAEREAAAAAEAEREAAAAAEAEREPAAAAEEARSASADGSSDPGAGFSSAGGPVFRRRA